MNRFQIVMSGPLPPAIGGMASVLDALKASTLSRRAKLDLFETGKTTPQGRPLWLGIATRLKLMVRWWRKFGHSPRPVAHIHTCDGLTFFLDGALLVLSRLRGAPVVLHVHGARFDSFLCTLNWPLARIAHWLARRCAVVIALSPGWQEKLSKHWPGADIRVVNNGVAISRTAHSVASNLSAPRFVFLGNLAHRKGVHVLLKAAALARENWTVDLVGGDGEPSATVLAEQEIYQRGLQSRCRLLGPLIDDAKVDLLSSAQGFVLPSLAEGLPMALLEAMSMGLPAVVTAVGAMPEAVRNGVEGLVVPADAAQALAEALDTLARQPQLRARMGVAAAQRCQSLYGIERTVDALMLIYAELGR